ncbi:MAG: VOC family protein [Kineosporiaceae bacterium]
MTLPDGSWVEVFSDLQPLNAHFGTAPVAGLLVDDVDAAAGELTAAGISAVHRGGDGGTAWAHFRAPDGNLYEITRLPVTRQALTPVEHAGDRGRGS